MSTGSDEKRLSPLLEVLDVVMQLAAGNFDARATMPGSGDEMDALVAGINMLAEEVNAKFEENARLVRTLEENMEDMAAQHRTILSLSTPSLLIWEGIVVLPLIGMLDTDRARMLSHELLNRIQRHATEVVILDVTGVAGMDTNTANHLLQTFAAVRLLGAQCILTGLTPENARSMTMLGIELGTVSTRGTLHDGLRLAFAMTGRRVYGRDRHTSG